jgi:hypothetical protein
MKAAKPYNFEVHRRLPEVQGGLWAVRLVDDDGAVVGGAIVGHAARTIPDVLAVLRVAVEPGHMNGCSMLYGACSGAARYMGAEDLVTYLHLDEHGASLKASNWVYGGNTDGGEWSRDGRECRLAIDPLPKKRWWAPWGIRAKRIEAARIAAQRSVA